MIVASVRLVVRKIVVCLLGLAVDRMMVAVVLMIMMITKTTTMIAGREDMWFNYDCVISKYVP
jgi:hypothetical protein